MNKGTHVLVLALLLGAPLAARAQQPGAPMNAQDRMAMACSMMMHGMMMGGAMPMGGQMGPMGGQMQGGQQQGMQGMQGGQMSDSMMMSHMQSELALSDAQMTQLQAVHQRACAAARPHLAMAMQAHQAAMQALQGDSPDLDAYEDQLETAATHMVEAQVEMAKGIVEARRALTPEQRQKMEQMHRQTMPQRMPGMRPDTAGDHQHHPGGR